MPRGGRATDTTVGNCARQTSLYLNRGKVDHRPIADRQEPIRHDSEHDDAHHDERRRNGPFDEKIREVHIYLSHESQSTPHARKYAFV
jgi:hypothetical protein